MKTFSFGGIFTSYYLFYYFKNPTDDFISHKILDFKSGINPQMSTFCEIAAAYFRHEKLKFDVVIRALGSKEVTAQNTSPLHSLSSSLDIHM